MSMCRNFPHAATSVNYTSEFREIFEATKYNKGKSIAQLVYDGERN